MDRYYDLIEGYPGEERPGLRKNLNSLIEKDPDFLDPYLVLCEIWEDEGNSKEADSLLDVAYKRALKLILDKDGNWPDILEWGFLENRHIIRTILNKAISLWDHQAADEALEIFRKLLHTNPNDNAGARYFILAIRRNMTFKEYEDRFDKGGYYDMDTEKWFAKNYTKFIGEFEQWRKSVEDFE